MDLDESIDAFKKPSNFVRKSRVQLKVKTNPRKRSQKKDGVQGSLKKSSVRCDSKSACLSNKTNAECRQDEFATCSKEMESGEHHSLFPCKTCGKEFTSVVLTAHAPSCLRVNFQACRAANENIEIVRCRNKFVPQGNVTDEGTTCNEMDVEENNENDERYFCPTCGRDLSSLDEEHRNTHANRCLDQIYAQSFLQKKQTVKQNKRPKAEALRCQFCTRVLKSGAGYHKHLLSCQKKQGFSTMSVLELNRPEEGDPGIELLQDIKKLDEHHPEIKNTHTTRKISKIKGRPKSEKGVSDYEQQVLQLAINVSRGTEEKGTKKKKEDIIPVMDTVSPRTKSEALKSRLHEMLIRSAEKNEEFPSTPTLPPTNLKFSSTHRSEENGKIVTGLFNNAPNSMPNQNPCTSRDITSSENNTALFPRNHNFTHAIQSHSNFSSPSRLSYSDVGSVPPNIIMSSPMARRHDIAHCSHYGNDSELQSPEVSSSNMRNSSVSESNDSPKMNADSDVQHQMHECDNSHQFSSDQSRKPSKWTMTTRAIPDNNDFVVKGLLSQFEKRNQNASMSGSAPVRSTSSIQASSAMEPTLEETDMDSTLRDLNILDNAEDGSSQSAEQEFHTPDESMESMHGNNVAFDQENIEVSSRTATLNKKKDNEPMCALEKLLDNVLHSDAKIVLGEDEKVIHVHKAILYCYCPQLLNAITSRENCVLHLREYEKNHFMPFLRYIYTGRNSSVLNGYLECENIVQTIASAAQRFNVEMPGISLTKSPILDEVKTDEEIPLNSVDVDFLSQPSPTQTPKSFEDPGSPTISYKGDSTVCTPSDEELNSDSDIFDFVENEQTDVKATNKSTSCVPEAANSGLNVSENLLPKPSFGPWDNSLQEKKDENIIVHDNSPKRAKPASNGKRYKKRKLGTSEISRRNLRFSSIKRRYNRKKSLCLCCETDSKHTLHGSEHKLRSSEVKRKRAVIRHLQKNDRIKQAMLQKRMLSSHRTGVKSRLRSEKNSSGSIKPKGGKSDISTKTPAAKRQRCISHTPPTQSKNKNDQTVYVNERLPRFKQRDYIRNRPGVANMGKSGLKSVRNPKKEIIDPPKKGAKLPSSLKKLKRLSLSQPVGNKSEDSLNEHEGQMYKFKRKMPLLKYINLESPNSTPVKSEQSSNDCETDADNYDCEPFPNSFNDDLFNFSPESDNLEERSSKADCCMGIRTPSSGSGTTCKHKKYAGEPITPMPNYDVMNTVEVKRNAQRYGIKKTLGKSALRTKLKEAFMYTHQVMSENDDENVRAERKETEETISEGESRASSDLNASNLSVEEMIKDSGNNIVDLMKHKLSRLSVSPQVQQEADNIYTFQNLTSDEVLALSADVVNKMHMDHSLLEALHIVKNETGSIKRGSLADKARCWDIVTPGSSGYDPKLNAILRLPEEYQSAITDPLVSCVVKNYIDYKKYMFDCLPALCDRMEKEMC